MSVNTIEAILIAKNLLRLGEVFPDAPIKELIPLAQMMSGVERQKSNLASTES